MRYAMLVITAVVLLVLLALASAPAAVTQTMGAAANSLFALFKDEAFPLLLAGAIIIAGLALAVAYGGFLVLPLCWRMRRRCQQLGRYRDRSEFAAAYPDIDESLARDPIIGHAWREFTRTLYGASSHSAEITTTVRPHAFINTGHVQDRNFALKLMPQLPNYFVGIGLLLTFVGLIAALNFATASVGGDVDEAVTGLENLLKAATFKFWTSVAGLGVSIVLSLVFRIYSSVIERALIDLCDAIEQKTAFASGQETLADMLAMQREQRDELARFNSDAAARIGTAVNANLNQQLPQALQAALEPVTDEVRGLRQAVVTESQTATGAAGDGSSSSTPSLNETLQQLKTTLAGMQGWVSAIDGNLPGLCDRLQQLEGTLANQSEAFGDVLAQERALAESLRHTSETLAKGVEPWQNVGQQLASSVERFDTNLAETSQQLQQALAGGQQLATSLEALSQSLTDSWQAYRERFEAVDEDLERAFQQITAAVDTHQERIQAFVTELDKSFTRATEQLNATVTDIAESADALNDALNHWVKPESLQR